MSFEFVEPINQSAVIKVIGVGGGGGNAVQHMLGAGIDGVDFVCANTDAQALRGSTAKTLLQLGGNITKGRGAGGDPEVARQAALEDRERIKDVIDGSDMIFITAGMGGGTGTGAAPVFAQIAKESGVLAVAVVTRPFSFEGQKRERKAAEGIRELEQRVDSLIIVPNDKLKSVLGENYPARGAFGAADDVLLGAVQGIAELITRRGLINVDFADVKTVMSETGMAMMGTGKAQGENRARVATETAVSSPLQEDINLSGAKGVLANITAGPDFSIGELDEVGDAIHNFAAEDATIVIGHVFDADMSGEIRVTIVATGLEHPLRGDNVTRIRPQPPKPEAPDYRQYDRPKAMRGANSAADPNPPEPEQDYDIPAFLRRQND